jgi:tetratricopeptide (TPR) repeat protein
VNEKDREDDPVGGEAAVDEMGRLESLGAREPGAPGFPSLAEAERRAGRPDAALRIAQEGLRLHPDRAAGRVALGLALLDLGRVDDARAELARVLEDVPDHPVAIGALAASGADAATSFEDLAEAELESAFEGAAAEAEEMVDANDLAAAALRAVEREAEDLSLAEPDSPFATETVAGLLERQGHEGRARAVRDVISQRSLAPEQGSDERGRVIQTLERWLENLRRGAR